MKTQIIVCLAPSIARPEPLSATIAESWVETEFASALKASSLLPYWTKRNGFLNDWDGFRIVERFDIPSEEANKHGARIARHLAEAIDLTDKAIDDLNDALVFSRYNDGETEDSLLSIMRSISARRTVAAIERVGKHLAPDNKFDGRTFDLSLGIPYLAPASEPLAFPGLQVLPACVDQAIGDALDSAARDLSLSRDFKSYAPRLLAPTRGFIIDLHS
jgi:hypothetical protein